jgi:hypothetical protein
MQNSTNTTVNQEHKVSAFHPFIFQKSGKSTIIRYLAVPRHFVAYLVFISSIRVDPGCVSFSELENDTLNQAELNEIKINENN